VRGKRAWRRRREEIFEKKESRMRKRGGGSKGYSRKGHRRTVKNKTCHCILPIRIGGGGGGKGRKGRSVFEGGEEEGKGTIESVSRSPSSKLYKELSGQILA